MARARNIKPGFFKNEDLAECSMAARLCFAGLWTLADREGRLEDRPKRIKTELFAADTIDVEPLLQELVRWKFIVRYEIDGLHAIQILKFSEHQTPHYSEKPSVIKPPPLPEFGATKKPENQEDSESQTVIKRGSQPPDSLIPDSLIPDSPPTPLPGGRRFAEFWLQWPASPRKVAKAECEKRWKARKLDEQADAILAHVTLSKASDQWRRGFEPAPLTYLNQRRWEDGAISAGEREDDEWLRGAR